MWRVEIQYGYTAQGVLVSVVGIVITVLSSEDYSAARRDSEVD
jgi:hypothetical protein